MVGDDESRLGEWALRTEDTRCRKRNGAKLVTAYKAIWGADPLEYHGGFHNLSYEPNATFSSALATNGSVQWSTTYATIARSFHGQVQAALNVSFPAVNWEFMKSVYGWSALQYQAWARGILEVKGSQPQTIALFGDGLLEFLVDGEQYFGGDMFQYHRVPSLIILAPGRHVLELRLTRDVRAHGGLSNAIKVTIQAELRGAEPITLDEHSLLISELANRKIGTPWASINVQNNDENLVEIKSIRALKVGSYVLPRYVLGCLLMLFLDLDCASRVHAKFTADCWTPDSASGFQDLSLGGP
ncbi:hypothetical protein PENSUB_5228 [Penicillium subrubescens]|uniref:Uncharacterized protein n=1 Tax=Penicillium subrubescens TaxID=1316194 RepID=A0A1Q5UAB2_9EURO|nr:hypothetical protein PENSUB_5228 [Penicillium subrubescens]